MKKICHITLLLISCSQIMLAQDMRTLLKSMPEGIFPLLTHNNVLDFIDFLDSDMKAEVTNKLGGRSEMIQLTDSTASIKMTPSSEAELRITKTDGKKLICITHIYHTFTQSNSSVTHYDMDWTRKEEK